MDADYNLQRRSESVQCTRRHGLEGRGLAMERRTIQAGVVVVDGLHHAAEVQLHVLFYEPSVERTQVALLIVHAAGETGHNQDRVP